MSPLARPHDGSDPPTVHAGAVLIGRDGVLIRGASGSGKSTLARALVAETRAAGRFAAHVADDRVVLRAAAGRLLARPASRLAGLVEVRGRGILAVDHEPAAVIRLVVDLVEAPPRLPDDAERETEIEGIRLPRLALAARSAAAREVLDALRAGGRPWSDPFAGDSAARKIRT